MLGKYLDCSTGHVTEKDDLLLRVEHHEDCGPISVARYSCGIVVFLPFAEELEDELKKIKEWGYSADLVALVRHAASKEASIIVLDRDGQVIDGLHINNW